MKLTTHRSRALRAGLMAGAASLLLSGGAFAQTVAATTTAAATAATVADAASADGNALGEVVVTAQKRTTNVQTTPIAISVMNEQALNARHVISLEDLSDGSIPSLRAAPFFARNSALTIGMRGIGAMGDANQPARDQAVGVYVDGVYLGRAQGLGAALYDIDRIEVAKGPQGTLYGRNTEGGAIAIVTKAPTGVFSMDTTVGAGDYNSYLAQTHVNLPEFHDVAIKVDGMLNKRDGVTNNPTSTGQPGFDSYDKRGVHAQALWRPTDKFSADYAYDVSYDGTTPYYVQLISKGLYPLAPILQVQPERATTANVGVPLQLSIGDTSGHRLTLDWKAAPGLEMKSISSYRALSESQYDDGEENLSVYAPNAPFDRYSLAHTYQNQFSEEVQAIGKTAEIDYIGGAFYYHEWVRDNAQTPNIMQFNANGTAASTLSVNLNTVSFDRADHVTTDSAGVFGQGTWTPAALGSLFHLTLGGRYTQDRKQGSLDTVNGALPSYVNTSGQTITGVVNLNKTWDRFDPLINLSYDATRDVHLYVKWDTGYKAGGANSRSLTYRAFDPETVSMYEVGAKTEFWDHRARLNVAAYYGELKDVQVDFSVIVPGNNRGTLETTNAATGQTRGVETDFAISPMTGLTLTASYAYTKLSLSQAFNPFTNAMSVVYPLYTPPNAGSVAIDYQHPVHDLMLSGHLDANYADGQTTSTTDPTLSNRSLILNGRIVLSDIRLSTGAMMQLSLWSRNLADEHHAFVKNFNAALGTYGIFNEPRTFGAEARVKF